MEFINKDKQFMRRVFELARRGQGLVSPNPMVAALLVKNGRVISEAWHKKFGLLHAEVKAIKKAKTNPAGATLYVNLEPCVAFAEKKTQACVPAIIKAKIHRVVIAMKDPNPRVRGRGIRSLRAANIKIDVGCLRDSATRLNEKYIKWISTGFPFVGMKVAMSMDGKIATKTGDSKWITSEKARKYARVLRDSYDAVLVGINTVIADNPMLAGKKREPLRIVLDSELRVSRRANVLRDSNVLIITASRAAKSKIAFFRKQGIPIKIFPGKIKITPLLRFLGRNSVSSVLVEGGSEVFGSFLDEKRVDRFYWFVAPKIIGGREAVQAVSGKGRSSIKKALRLNNFNVKRLGADILIEARGT